jgi:hypothetical protein
VLLPLHQLRSADAMFEHLRRGESGVHSAALAARILPPNGQASTCDSLWGLGQQTGVVRRWNGLPSFPWPSGGRRRRLGS